MVHALIFILKFYSIKMKKMNLDIEGVEGFDKSQCSIIVYITFAVCIILRVNASKVHWWNKRQTFLKPTLKDKMIVISRWVFWLAWKSRRTSITQSLSMPCLCDSHGWSRVYLPLHGKFHEEWKMKKIGKIYYIN